MSLLVPVRKCGLYEENSLHPRASVSDGEVKLIPNCLFSSHVACSALQPCHFCYLISIYEYALLLATTLKNKFTPNNVDIN